MNIRPLKAKEACSSTKSRRFQPRGHFTLLELLVVLFLLSCGALFTGVKVKEMYRQQRFLSQTQQVLNHLAMAQDIMLIMDTDVAVTFAKDRSSGGTTLKLEVDKPLEVSWAKFVERRVELGAVESVEFHEAPADEILLYFSLGQMSRGILVLHGGAKEEEHFCIELPGYPSPLIKGASAVEEESGDARSRDLYPAEVYRQLYEKNPLS